MGGLTLSTDAQRKANAAFHAKREAEGLKKVTLWLSPEARFKLDALKKAAGSKDKAADAAILAWSGPTPVVNHMAAVRQIVEGAALAKQAPAPKPWSGGHPKPGKVKR